MKIANKSLRLRLSVTTALVMCTSIVSAQTLGSIYGNNNVNAATTTASGSADERAIRSYEKYIQNNPSAKNLAQVKHRLADIRFKQATKVVDAGGNADEQLQSVLSQYEQIIKQHSGYTEMDEVLYQAARSAELIGANDAAERHLNSIINDYPNSKYFDETQFRMAELDFVRGHFARSAKGYNEVIKYGSGSKLYKEALLKKGWALFKLGQYKQSLPSLLRLMDIESRRGLNGQLVVGNKEKTDETIRIITLDFYYLGGANTVKPFLKKNGGSRIYEELIYDGLSRLYEEKNIPVEAAKTYLAYLKGNKYSREAPRIHEKAIAIFDKAGYTDEVIKQKERFVRAYQPRSDYWKYFSPGSMPSLDQRVKATCAKLITHYHLEWQQSKSAKSYKNANKWYKYYLELYRDDMDTPKISYQYAGLLYDAKQYDLAYAQYERTAYDYGQHSLAADAGFASVQSMDKYIETLEGDEQAEKKQASATVFMKFAYGFPQHPKASEVVKTTAQRLYEAEDYEQSADISRVYIDRYASGEVSDQREMWALMGVASHKAENYANAEMAYNEVLGLTEPNDPKYTKALDQLAATIYDYAKKAEEEGEVDKAARALLRIRQKAPYSEIAISAQYDAAAIYIKSGKNKKAIKVLEALRRTRPNNQYSKDIVRKLAILYAEDEQYLKAAQEYLVIGRTDEKQDTQRAATLKAAEFYDKADKKPESIIVYREFIQRFPEPADEVIEVMSDIAAVYKKQNNMSEHYAMLRKIIAADAGAGDARNNRTKYLAAKATIGIATPRREAYEGVALTLPLDASLEKKKTYFQATVKAYELANTYGVDEIVTESNYYVGNIYYDFSRALMNSERPKGLSELEEEQYTVLLEDQAYPFEEKAINLLEINTARMWEQNIYDEWIKRSITLLGKLLPYKYNKPEKQLDYAQFD